MVVEVLALVKARLGISTTVRDVYLTAIISGVIKELGSIQGIIFDETDASHLMFVADYAEYRYSNKDVPAMPRHLQWRLHNLATHSTGLVVTNILLVETLPIIPIAKTVYILFDGTKQIYVNDIWITVDMVDGVWTVI